MKKFTFTKMGKSVFELTLDTLTFTKTAPRKHEVAIPINTLAGFGLEGKMGGYVSLCVYEKSQNSIKIYQLDDYEFDGEFEVNIASLREFVRENFRYMSGEGGALEFFKSGDKEDGIFLLNMSDERIDYIKKWRKTNKHMAFATFFIIVLAIILYKFS